MPHLEMPLAHSSVVRCLLGHVAGTLAEVAGLSEAQVAAALVDLERRIDFDVHVLASREHSLRAEQAARLGAERLAARLAQLQALTAALSKARCRDDVVRATLAHGPPVIGAATAVLHARGPDPSRLELIGQIGLEGSVLASHPSLDARGGGLVATAVRTGEPAWMDGLDAMRARSPVAASLAQGAGIRSLVVLPLHAGGRALGALSMGFHGPLAVSEQERSYALTAAELCAQALDRVLAHAVVERAAARAERLQELTAALSEARTTTDIAAVAVAQGCAAVGAPRGFIGLVSEDAAWLDVLHRVGYPAEVAAASRRIPLSAPGPAASVVGTGDALFFDSAAAVLAPYPRLGALRHPGDDALAAVPLAIGGRVIGTIGFVFGERHPFDEEERAFLVAVGRQCAHALDRAHVYEAEGSARAAAEAANVMKDQFLSTLSHELRTPLTSILGWANILRTRTLDPAATARAVAIIERNARSQVQLIEDILDVSRIVTDKLRLTLRPVDPAAVVRTALEVLRPAAESRRIRVEAVIDGALGTIPSDPDRLQQIVSNLLTNAVKFSALGGVVEVGLVRRADEVELRVVDHGEGIDPRFLPHVFERFRQADASDTRAHGGLGLGLAICKHLVELHGGVIVAASAGAGQGATFTVTLPAHARDAAASRPPMGDPVTPPPASSRLLDGVRVVVVDDEPDARELLSSILQGHGATVTTASSAREALRAVQFALPHVLVSDISMPHEDGYSLLQQVRALASEPASGVAALALTAYAGREAARRAEAAGFQRHLAKPVLPARLIDEVAWLAGRAGAG